MNNDDNLNTTNQVHSNWVTRCCTYIFMPICKYVCTPTTSSMYSKGVPQFYGLYFAMGKDFVQSILMSMIITCFYTSGFALIMEGFMSAIYHVCPSGLNFQFGECDSFLITCYKDVIFSMQTQHSCSSLEGYSLLRCYNLVILTSMHMQFSHSYALLLSFP